MDKSQGSITSKIIGIADDVLNREPPPSSSDKEAASPSNPNRFGESLLSRSGSIKMQPRRSLFRR